MSSTQVVTAAHCVAEEEGEEIVAVEAGAVDGTREPATFVAASRGQIHERFSSKTGANDIALITLTRPLDDVATVSVPNAAEWAALTSAGAAVQSAGWCSTYSGGDNVSNFLVADLMVVPDPVCGDARATYPIGPMNFYGIGSEFEPVRIICAGGVTSAGLPIDTCQGEGRVRAFSQGSRVSTSPRLRVTVRWEPPRDDGASTVTHYRARCGSDGLWSRWKRVERTSRRLHGLREDERYRVQVRAVNAAGAGHRASYRLR